MIMETATKLHWKVKRFRTLALKAFQTLNDLNPVFMENLFAKREVSKRRKGKLEVLNRNTVRYGDKRIWGFGPPI